MRFYAVYDTNVLISSLLTRHSDTATAQVVDAILNEEIVPLYNQEILANQSDFDTNATRFKSCMLQPVAFSLEGL